MTTWTTWSPPGAPFPFSTAIDNGEWMFITEAGHDPATGELSESTYEQTKTAIAKIAHRLEQSGFSMSDIVMIRPYVTSREVAGQFDTAFAEALPEPRPYTAALTICELFNPEMKMEVEIVAQKGAELR
ncbi:Rid family hydrolase [Nocardia sp. NPDC059239]|uniref:Rid family hydrolase n=1 Tax=unclassified Nocardia TaxID=2637762 RepID=UPI0036BCE441